MSTLGQVEQAVRAWVITGSGLAPDHVFFVQQKVDRPAGTFATILIDGPAALGGVDSIERIFDETRPAGQEIEVRVQGLRALHVSVQVWGGPVVVVTGSTLGMPLGSPLGADIDSALSLAARIRTSLRLPSIRDGLTDAGVSPYATGPVRNLGALLGTDFDGRAQFDASFYWVESVSEFEGYIAEVEITDEGTGQVLDVVE